MRVRPSSTGTAQRVLRKKALFPPVRDIPGRRVPFHSFTPSDSAWGGRIRPGI